MKYMLQRYEKASTIQNKNTKFFIFIVERLRVGELCSGMRKYLRRSQRYEKVSTIQNKNTKFFNFYLVRLKPVVTPAAVGHERYLHVEGMLHLLQDNLLDALLLVRIDAEVEFVVYL